MELNDISYNLRTAIFEVHSVLGPGLYESVYQGALIFELIDLGLSVSSEVALPANYKGVIFETGFRIDIVVEDAVIVEVKSVDALHDVHKKQLLTYLKLSGKKLGILVNFNASFLTDKVDIIRIIN